MLYLMLFKWSGTGKLRERLVPYRGKTIALRTKRDIERWIGDNLSM
jgi:hypothetical protein